MKLALNMLFYSKLRSWLTIIGIVIGVGAVVGIVSLGDSMQENMQSKLASMDLSLITITPGYTKATSNMPGPGPGPGGPPNGGSTKSSTQLTDLDVDALSGVVNIMYVTGLISGDEVVSYNGENATLLIIGVDPQVWNNINSLEVESGRKLEPSDGYSVILGNSVASGLYKNDIQVNQVITINEKSVRVVGILTEEGGPDDRQIYMPIDSAINVITGAKKDVYNSIQVKAQSPDVVDTVVNDVESKLITSRHINNEDDKDFTVTALKSMSQAITKMVSTNTLFLEAIAVVSLIVGAVGIANTMFTSVLEKTKEIGTMKAIGAKNRDILMIFLFNSAMVGLVGGILGVILGSFVSVYLQTTIGNMTSASGLSLKLIVEGLLLAILIGVASGLAPAYRASKLKPVDALRYE